MHPYLLHNKILTLSRRLKKKNFLSIALKRANEIFSENLSFGVEIEFYSNNLSLEQISEIIPDYNFIKERGVNQFEYHIGPYFDLEILISKITNSFEQITKNISLNGSSDIFHPKYFENDYGSSLQVQISSGCKKFQDNLDKICESLCETSSKLFLAYAPTKEDYLRFDRRFMAPTHISYGFNNRTCLYRINGQEQKRIEFRASSSYCDLYVLFSTILAQIISFSRYNENDNKKNYSRIYGNAFEEQYQLEEIPGNIEEAELLFDEKIYEIF